MEEVTEEKISACYINNLYLYFLEYKKIKTAMPILAQNNMKKRK